MELPTLTPLPNPAPAPEPGTKVRKVLECNGILRYDAQVPVWCDYRAVLEYDVLEGRKSVSVPPCPQCGNGSWREEAFE